MKKVLLSLSIMLIIQVSANAQFLKKLQQKAADAAEKVIDKKLEQKTDQLIGNESSTGTSGASTSEGFGNSTSAGNSSASKSGKMRNTEGGGLITTPPDVKENLNSAETAFKGRNYGASRYAIQQAILGVEMEIGNKLLKSLPETIAGLPKLADQDQVSSSGWGWAGLNIQRSYQNDSKQFTFTIANNSMLSALNQFIANGAYAQTSTGGAQKWKQIMVKGSKAIIEYDADSGYKVNVPLGQSSLLAFEGVNFKTEQDMLAAVNQLNIDEIKKTLGEK
jgi:hypothetical protein